MAKTGRAPSPRPRRVRVERWGVVGFVGFGLAAIGVLAFIGIFTQEGFVVATVGAAFTDIFGRAAPVAAVASAIVGPPLLLSGVQRRAVVHVGHVLAAVVFVLSLTGLTGDRAGWIGRMFSDGLAAGVGEGPAYALLYIAAVAAAGYALMASARGAAATRLAGRILIDATAQSITITCRAATATVPRLRSIFRPRESTGAGDSVRGRRSPRETSPALSNSEPADWQQEPLIRTAPVAPPTEIADPEIDRDARWVLPPIDLLHPSPPATDVPDTEINAKANVIADTLGSFNIEATVPEAIPGPVVTQYLVRPGAGVKVARITALVNDLALKLAARSIRIEAPVPGRPYLGIELPNDDPLVVRVREVMESEAWVASNDKLKIALGKDVAGAVRVVDLTAMPHLLIAGATGSGKSVCLTSIITGLLSQATPDELQLVLIDPKMVELVTFEGVPHLRMNVVTDVADVVPVLDWVSREMARRYRIFNKASARNISTYNAKPTEATGGNPLPFLVVVIDELADLMMTAPGDVERVLARLAHLARATGIHLVISTQRPSVDVITGLIKANFPTRISFMVSSQADSRTILDSAGAERLIGRGDMLFSPPEGGTPSRIQGVYVEDDEINSVVEHWRAQGTPQIVTANELREAAEQVDDTDEEIYVAATELVMRSESITPDFLSRELRVGRTKAQDLAMQLEKDGFVGPPEPQSMRRRVRQRDGSE